MLLVTMGIKKYFIAIVIPNPLQGEIEAIKQQLLHGHNLKGALRSPAHITLHRPFAWKEEKENVLLEKLAAFTFKKPFGIALKDFAFFEPRVIYADVLPNTTLFELHDALMQFAKRELKLFNELDDRRGFHPHVTVAFRDLKKPLFYELQKTFATQTLQGNFKCDTFSILKLEQKWSVLKDFNI
jgi:2'-5' RNA ligase